MTDPVTNPNDSLESILARADIIAAATPDAPASRRRRWPIVAAAGGVIAAGALVWGLTGGDGPSETADAAPDETTLATITPSTLAATTTTTLRTVATTNVDVETVAPGTVSNTLPPLSAPLTPITLPPVAIQVEPTPTLPTPSSTPTSTPTSTPSSSPSSTVVSSPASTSTTLAPVPAPDTDSVTGAQPLSAQQKGELFVVTGSVRSEAERAELVRRLAGVAPRRLRNDTYVNPDSAPLPNDLVVTVRDGLQFGVDEATIDSATGRLALDAIAELLAARPDLGVRIEGHTDDEGSDSYNLQLSRQRAQAAVDYLRRQGVDVDRLEAVPVGEAAPIADNGNELGRLANRRLEISITGLLRQQ